MQEVFISQTYNCNSCNKKFSSKIMLMQHNTSGSCQYSCKHCEFTFMRQCDLDNHIRIHLVMAPALHGNTNLEIKEEMLECDVKDEIKEEVIDEDPLFVKKINISGENENELEIDDVDIVEHKLEVG